MPNTINPNDVRIFSGRSHPDLAAGIAEHLGVPLEKTHFSRFSNDNLFIQLCASVRGRVVIIVQSLIPPVSDNLLELLMMLDIARSAAASEVHAIIPYFSYARSDKKNAPRISITARLIADLLETAGATQVMTMTLHSPQVHGFFHVPTDPLTRVGIVHSPFEDLELQSAGYDRGGTRLWPSRVCRPPGRTIRSAFDLCGKNAHFRYRGAHR